MSGKCLCSWSFSNSVPCNRGYHIPTAKKSQAFYLCLSKTDISNCSSFIYYNWESCFLGDSEICLSIDLFFKDKYKRVTKKKQFPRTLSCSSRTRKSIMNISTSIGKKHHHLRILPIGALSWTFLGHVMKWTVSKIEASK